MPGPELDPPTPKEPRSRSSEPKTKAEREAVLILAECDNLLDNARRVIKKVAVASSCTSRQLHMCDRRLDVIEAEFNALLRRAALHNSSAPADFRVDLAPTRDLLGDLVLDFRFQHEELSSPSSAAGAASSSAASSPSPARLPDMTLPPFSGHFREWPRFRSVVEETLLRHPNASEVQRYSALSSSLSGEPAQLISSAALLPASFSAAWALLLQRYDRPRFLGYAFIDALLDCPPATSSQPSSLQALASSVREFVQVLHAQPDLANEVSLESHFVARLVLRKLPSSLCQRFEEQSPSPGLPTLLEVLSFLDIFCSAAERVRPGPASLPRSAASTAPSSPASGRRQRLTQASSSTPSSRLLAVRGTQTSTAPSSAQSAHLCAFCHGTHSIRQCREFKAMRCASRRQEVDRLRLCRNCMSALHATTACTSSQRCHSCGGRHHTILHMAPSSSQPVAAASSAVSTAARQPPSASPRGRPGTTTSARPASSAPASGSRDAASIPPPAAASSRTRGAVASSVPRGRRSSPPLDESELRFPSPIRASTPVPGPRGTTSPPPRIIRTPWLPEPPSPTRSKSSASSSWASSHGERDRRSPSPAYSC